MKKWTIGFLVLAMFLAGCSNTGSLTSGSAAKSATAASGRSYFWDKDVKPVTTASSQPEEIGKPLAANAETPPAAEPSRRDRTRTAQADIVTASIEEVQPVAPVAATPAYSYEKTVGIGPDLISVNGSTGQAFTMVYPRPDYGIMQIDKAMPKEIRLDHPFNYVIKVTNLTDTMLDDILLTETLSREFTFRGSEPTASIEGNRLSWTIGSLGPKANKTITISGIATNARQLEHCTTITHTTRNCAVVQVVEPTLQIVMVAPPEALLCETIPLEFVVTNTGTGVAQNVQIADALPAGLQTADGKNAISLDVGTLVAGESRRFAVKLRATKVGTYSNKAVATSAAGLKADSEVSILNVRQPVLAITKSGPQRQYLGRPLSYEITVVNKGDGPARDTIIEDLIPPGVISIEATSGAQFSASKLTWELGTLEPNASRKVKVSYTPTKEGEVMATAVASAYCAETATDSARTTVTAIAAPRVEVVDLEDPVEVGSTTTYVVTVTNEGSAPDRNIRISCVLDDKMQYVSSAGATAGSIMGKTVSFAPLQNLAPKAKATWRIVVRGARAGDALFRVTMHADSLSVPVDQTEATHVYQQR